MRELVIGCGVYRKRRIYFDTEEYENPVYLDMNPDVQPDVVWDLNKRPLPFKDNEFDEIHAYDVLEHVGMQGDWEGFFEEFNEYYRILKPGGKFFITVPLFDSKWSWSDPGHTRVITPGTFTFLDQSKYNDGSQMTDYRFIYKGNFKFAADLTPENSEAGIYVLEAV